MTLTTMLLNIGLVAIILTLIVGFVFKKHNSWIMTFLQNFVGALFIFSGWVKIVDPLGTAYKMESYFTEFQYTFEGTWMSFIAPIFPFFSNYSIWFSMTMIVFEIVLGIMLIIGARPKLTAWLFFLLVAFFTVLTGFTYLTGYVPDSVNFFDFGNWVDYKASNMKVTDCGCFGDFIKLEPRTSFFKDIALLFPALYFLFRHKDKHQLFSKGIRDIIIALSTLGLIIFGFNNFKWNLPSKDFRPFKIGADVASIKEAEQDAQANVKITDWRLKNEFTNEELVLPSASYYKQLQKYNKKNGWKVLEQISTKPTIKSTKISDFEIEDFEGNEVTDVYLEGEGYNFMIVSYKVYGIPISKSIEIQDTTYTIDTVQIAEITDSKIVKSIKNIQTVTKTIQDYKWDKDWLAEYVNKIKPLAEKAKLAGHKVSVVLGGVDVDMAIDLAKETGIDANYYHADDILLKTIVRSNPGVVLWKNGKIINKWHKNKLPNYSVIETNNIK
ncbi:MAG: DoxX family protein [Saprospiraceae bacterium]